MVLNDLYSKPFGEKMFYSVVKVISSSLALSLGAMWIVINVIFLCVYL